MDDDLQHLLDQLDPETPTAKPKPAVKSLPIEDDETSDAGEAWVDGVIDPSELMGDIDGVSDDIDSDIPVPTDVRSLEDMGSGSSTALATLIDAPPLNVNLQKYLDRLDGVTDEILGACRSDRQEAQDVIQMFRQEIEQALNQNKAPSRMFVDGLVKAVEVKANINMTAVKMMEANAKMLASMKATTSVQVNNQNVSLTGNDRDLERVLDEPMTADDEY